jgi:SAM-dependent methyltransferase
MSHQESTAEKAVVADRFGAEAQDWERYYGAGSASTISLQNILTRIEIVLEMLGDGPGHALDVGSAAGAVSVMLADRGWTVDGIDISEGMVRWAQERVAREGRTGLTFAVADIDALPFPNGRFDAIVAMGVIEYLESDAKALDELVRVLRPGGRIVVTTPNLISPFRWVDEGIRRIEKPLVPLLRRLRYGADGSAARGRADRPRLFHRDYTLGGLASQLERRGVSVQRKAGHSWGSYRLDPFVRFGAPLTRVAKAWSEAPVLRSIGASLVVSGVKR